MHAKAGCGEESPFQASDVVRVGDLEAVDWRISFPRIASTTFMRLNHPFRYNLLNVLLSKVEPFIGLPADLPIESIRWWILHGPVVDSYGMLSGCQPHQGFERTDRMTSS
jgi:hypothetical protein